MKTDKPVKQLSDQHRAMLDPAVRRVKAMRLQTAEAGVQVDTMLTLVFPEWDSGKFIYDPESGGFFKKGAKLAKSSDPLNRPHSKRSGG
jgi:hypothetical protein